MTCRGICTRYKSPTTIGSGKYNKGLKRCQICEIFIKWAGIWCPCCGYRLRTKPRNRVYKSKLRGDYVEPEIDIPTKNENLAPNLRTNKRITRPRGCRCTCHFNIDGTLKSSNPCDFCGKYHIIKIT